MDITTRVRLHTLLALVCLVLVNALPSASARAALGPRSATPASTIQSGGPTDPGELGAFLDAVLPAQLAAAHIPGAAVAVVRDGRVLVARGYGDADRERGAPVDADRTLFRLGSLDKVFVATAVMQLVEGGQLDLHADVNTYLTDFQVPATYPQPITLAHLLTHTAGFEDRAELARTADDLLPPGEYLARHLPARVRPPGELAVYSNPGWTLAGYIVAQVAGIPFERYVEEHILRPLAMGRSTFRQPVPPELAAQLAVGYTGTDGAYRPGAFEYIQGAPAGVMSATAGDMAHFLVAQLQLGRYGEGRILGETGALALQRRQFAQAPAVAGLTYGFEERHLNGRRLLWKDGDTTLFASALALLPEERTGLFVAYNGPGGQVARRDLLRDFLDHYYPAAPAAPTPSANAPEGLGQFAGSYRSARIPTTTFAKLQALFDTRQVRATPDGTLLAPDGQGRDRRWVAVAPLVFQEEAGAETLTFRADPRGRITHLFLGNEPTTAFAKVAWYDAPPVHLATLTIGIPLLLSAVVLLPLGPLRARRRAAVGGPHLPGLARALAGAVGALQLLFVAGLVATLGDPTQLAFGPPPLLRAALAAALLGAILTGGLVVGTALGWRRRYWGLPGRLHYTLVAAAALAFVGELAYWNLLGFRF
jgi:CubicO group peptidase (beta-lactamase class C family)